MLDIGSEVGLELKYMSDIGWKVDAVEPIPVAKYFTSYPDINLITGEILNYTPLNQLHQSYDVILSLTHYHSFQMSLQ